jgi:4-aminobutyrate aminotransferase-like enzyme
VLANVEAAGAELRAEMSRVTRDAELPCHVRGVGLMNTLELVTDGESKRYWPVYSLYWYKRTQ